MDEIQEMTAEDVAAALYRGAPELKGQYVAEILVRAMDLYLWYCDGQHYRNGVQMVNPHQRATLHTCVSEAIDAPE